MAQTQSERDLVKRLSGVRQEPEKWYRGESCQLNFDSLLLIAAYSHPCDLWSLASTCKYLRELLMDRSSALIWKTARSRIQGFPDCPTDLTEQEYANLAFCARCHGCGRYTATIFWEMRRRYCPDCRAERLCCLSLCHEIVQKRYVLGMEHLTVEREMPLWVDREQMESFMDEYNRSSDKKRLLNNKQEQIVAICKHARQCEYWQSGIDFTARQERDRNIFERLKQAGYQPEIEFFGHFTIWQTRRSIFNTPKLLTDKEWARIWSEWIKTMKDLRLQRLEETVFHSRRRSLVDEYNTYVKNLSQNTPFPYILPHVADVARFPPFRDIIRAPEGTQMSDNLFESAFAQLPGLVDEWRNKLDCELEELVQIPSHLSFTNTRGGQVMASSSMTGLESCQATTNKLHLACARFCGKRRATFACPDILFTTMHHYNYPSPGESDSERTGSIWDRFGIKYVEEAPYVVHACGLDPSVATVEDMDRRDARLKCLSCTDVYVYRWKEAVWHAYACHRINQARWQLIVDDSKEMEKVRAAELTANMEAEPYTSVCLLCDLCVGGEMQHHETIYHLMRYHKIEKRNFKFERGIHYLPLTMRGHYSVKLIKGLGQEESKFKVVSDHLVW